MLRSDDEVQDIRARNAEQAAQEQQMQMAAIGADVAQKLSVANRNSQESIQL
jgi:predicted exporter